MEQWTLDARGVLSIMFRSEEDRECVNEGYLMTDKMSSKCLRFLMMMCVCWYFSYNCKAPYNLLKDQTK